MGMLGKIATTIIGTRIAAETGKAGLAGVAVGMIATRVIARSPVGALAVGGAYLAHKLWQKKRQIDREGSHRAAIEDGLTKPDTSVLAPLNQRSVYRKARPVKPGAPIKRRSAMP